MSCRTNRSSVNWGADLARTPPPSAPPATSPDCLALVADAEAAARYLATYGMKIRGATVEETEAARYALPTGAIPADMYVPAGPWVDIYLSAGPSNILGSCDADDDSNCRLYRVRWNLVAGTAYEVVELSSSSGAVSAGFGDVQPALSPDERSLAWIRRNGARSRLLRQSHGEAGPTLVYEGTHSGEDRPQFPNWVTDHILAFHSKMELPKDDKETPPEDDTEEPPEDSADSTSVEGPATLWYAALPSAPERFLGPNAPFQRERSFADVDTHRAPAYHGSTGPRIVTHGGTGDERIPHVTNLFGGQDEPFELGFEDANAMCHHAAWNKEGTRILCHAASERERFGEGRKLTTLYEYQYAAATGSWIKSETSAGTDGKVFDSPDAAALDEVLFRDGATGTLYFFKYAEWCGSDDYVLATLYCGTDRGEILSSRVVVVTLRGPDGAPRLSDVTSAVETAMVTAGRLPTSYRPQWRGVFGTCSKPRHAPLWAATLP